MPALFFCLPAVLWGCLPPVVSPPRRVWIWVYLRWLLRTCLQSSTQEYGTFTSGGAEMFTYGLPSSRGGVYLRCFWDVYLRWGRDSYAWRHGRVYLRWFRLHSAGVDLSIPPVAPADVPAIAAQELGHLPAVLQTITCGAGTRLPSGGCIPAVRLFAFNF